MATNQKVGCSNHSGRTIHINVLAEISSPKLSTMSTNLGGLIVWFPHRRSVPLAPDPPAAVCVKRVLLMIYGAMPHAI